MNESNYEWMNEKCITFCHHCSWGECSWHSREDEANSQVLTLSPISNQGSRELGNKAPCWQFIALEKYNSSIKCILWGAFQNCGHSNGKIQLMFIITFIV